MSETPTHRRRFNWPAVVLGLLLVWTLGYQSYALKNAPFEPSVIATVDIETLYNSLKIREQAEADLQTRAEQLQKEIEKRENEIQRLEEDLNIFEPGSEQYRQAQEEFSHKALQHRARVEAERQILNAQRALKLREIYRRIKQSVTEFSKQNGIDVVFINDSISEIPRADEQETMRQISARRMLYVGEQVDITQTIIDRMNREFDADNQG